MRRATSRNAHRCSRDWCSGTPATPRTAPLTILSSCSAADRPGWRESASRRGNSGGRGAPGTGRRGANCVFRTVGSTPRRTDGRSCARPGATCRSGAAFGLASDGGGGRVTGVDWGGAIGVLAGSADGCAEGSDSGSSVDSGGTQGVHGGALGPAAGVGVTVAGMLVDGGGSGLHCSWAERRISLWMRASASALAFASATSALVGWYATDQLGRGCVEYCGLGTCTASLSLVWLWSLSLSPGLARRSVPSGRPLASPSLSLLDSTTRRLFVDGSSRTIFVGASTAVGNLAPKRQVWSSRHEGPISYGNMARPSLRRAVLLLALAPSSSRRTIQLVNEDGKVVMTPEDASCQACHRVLAHLANRTELSVDKVPGGGGAASASRRKQREDAVNMELYVSQVLDSKSCLDEMSEHDLGHVDGKQMFVRKEAGGHNAYPVHMDLNQKAKTELANFCFAFIEENEDALEELIRAGANLTDEAICRDQLNYCAPPPPPPPPPRKKRAHTERPMNQEQRRALTKKAR